MHRGNETKKTNPLMKRIPRELRKDLGKYIALFLFMSMLIGLVSGFIVADSTERASSVMGWSASSSCAESARFQWQTR